MQDQETPKIASGQKAAEVPALPAVAGLPVSSLSRRPGQHSLHSGDTQQARPELEGHLSGGACGAFSSDSSRPPARGAAAARPPACTPPPASSGSPGKSEEAGAPQASGLAQVGRQGVAHVLGGGADALGGLHGFCECRAELLQVLQVQLDGASLPPGHSGGGRGGPVSRG